MSTKTRLAPAFAALALGVTAFASVSEARVPYYRHGWGWEVPEGYAPHVIKTRHGTLVCRWYAEYDDWGMYVGNSRVCSRH
jgi:hypothetical protein